MSNTSSWGGALTQKSPRSSPSRRRPDPDPPPISIPEFSTTLRWLRESRGLSREEAAIVLEFSAVHLGRFERGESLPSAKFMELIISGYRLGPAMAAHLRDLAIPAIPLSPAPYLRTWVQRDPSLLSNLDRFQTRNIPAAYVDPLWNVLAHNDLFAEVLPGIDESRSLPVWMFTDTGKAAVVDPEAEGAWSVSMLKGIMGKYRDSEQARELVTALTPNEEAQRFWAAGSDISFGRDSRFLLHAHSPGGVPVSYQLTLTESILAHHIQLFTATPEPYSGPEIT
ncbi:helix-turn-helix domain-containing protein [Nocardia sp. NPDC087230]|uniref:helix-turn-helix domain-containing protein n=1 Tax=Nocardia sp. NPDC087230 TaxID=3364331 RepID=UPI00381E5C8C